MAALGSDSDASAAVGAAAGTLDRPLWARLHSDGGVWAISSVNRAATDHLTHCDERSLPVVLAAFLRLSAHSPHTSRPGSAPPFHQTHRFHSRLIAHSLRDELSSGARGQHAAQLQHSLAHPDQTRRFAHIWTQQGCGCIPRLDQVSRGRQAARRIATGRRRSEADRRATRRLIRSSSEHADADGNTEHQSDFYLAVLSLL